MTQRTLAGLVAVLLLGCAGRRRCSSRCPTSPTSPGPPSTCSARTDGKEIIQVTGAQDLPRRRRAADDHGLGLHRGRAGSTSSTLMADWINPEDAVYPYDAVYQADTTPEQNREEGQVEMVSSQDAATAAALRELGYDRHAGRRGRRRRRRARRPTASSRSRDILARGRRHADQVRRRRGQGRQRGARPGKPIPCKVTPRRQGRQGRRDRDHADGDRRRTSASASGSGPATSSRSTSTVNIATTSAARAPG